MKKARRRIVNKPMNDLWGFNDTPWKQYDEVEIIPAHSLGSGKSAWFPEKKRVFKVGKQYRIRPTFLDKRLKAELRAVYNDPIGFGDKGKRTPVRLKTEWKFMEGKTMKGRREIVEDINLDYGTRTKRQQKLHSDIWRKNGMNSEKGIAEIKKAIRLGKY